MKNSVIFALALFAFCSEAFASDSIYVALATGGIREDESLLIDEETSEVLQGHLLSGMPKCKTGMKCVQLVGFIFELPVRRNGRSTWKSGEISYIAAPLLKDSSVEMIELFDEGSSNAFAKVIYSRKRGVIGFTFFEDKYKESSSFILISKKGVLAGVR